MHTKAPWVLKPSDFGPMLDPSEQVESCGCIIGDLSSISSRDQYDGSKVVCVMVGDDAESKANAKLIWAAPKLLEALEEAVRLMQASDMDMSYDKVDEWAALVALVKVELNR